MAEQPISSADVRRKALEMALSWWFPGGERLPAGISVLAAWAALIFASWLCKQAGQDIEWLADAPNAFKLGTAFFFVALLILCLSYLLRAGPVLRAERAEASLLCLAGAPSPAGGIPDPLARRLSFQAAFDALIAGAERAPQWPASEGEVTQLIEDTERVVKRYCTASAAALILKSFRSQVATPFIQGSENRQVWESVLMRYPEWASKIRNEISGRDMRLDDPDALRTPSTSPDIAAQMAQWKHSFQVDIQRHVDAGNALGEEASVEQFLEWLEGAEATIDDYLTNTAAKRERMHFANVFNSFAILREGPRRCNVPRRACLSWIDRLRAFVTEEDMRPDFKKRPMAGRDPWPGVRYEPIPDIIPGVPDQFIRWADFQHAGVQPIDIRKWSSIREWEEQNDKRFGPPARPAPPESKPPDPPAC